MLGAELFGSLRSDVELDVPGRDVVDDSDDLELPLLLQVAQHLAITRACKRAFPDLILVGTGYTYLQEWLPNVAQHEVGAGHVDSVGLGRMVLSYPELPRDVLRGTTLARKKICRTFSDCTTAPRNGMVSGCYPLDPDYKDRPERDRLEEIKRGLKESSKA